MTVPDYEGVAISARAYLKTIPRGTTITTSQLVEALAGPSRDTKETLYRAIKALTYGRLADCWALGPEVMRYGKMVKPKLWHRPEAKTCLKCGEELP